MYVVDTERVTVGICVNNRGPRPGQNFEHKEHGGLVQSFFFLHLPFFEALFPASSSTGAKPPTPSPARERNVVLVSTADLIQPPNRPAVEIRLLRPSCYVKVDIESLLRDLLKSSVWKGR